MYKHMRPYTYIHTYIHIRTHIYTHTYVYIFLSADNQKIFLHTYIQYTSYAFENTHTHTYIHTHTHIHTYTHTHTHTESTAQTSFIPDSSANASQVCISMYYLWIDAPQVYVLSLDRRTLGICNISGQTHLRYMYYLWIDAPQVYIYAQAYTYIQAYVCTYVYVCIYAYIHTYIPESHSPTFPIPKILISFLHIDNNIFHVQSTIGLYADCVSAQRTTSYITRLVVVETLKM